MDNFIEFLYSKFLQSDGVSIDTRSIAEDNLFFALKGPNFNANKYAHQALDKGAAFVVVDEEKYADDPRIILAPDAMKALQELATFHRSRYKRKLLGITGSNGKTTTKELINLVLSKKYVVHATKGNYNNHLGVPITLLHIHPQVEVAIIEMGANHVGEIAELCGYANPNFGLITNIGEAHTETFGGIEGVLRGKSELFDHLRKNKGTPFINVLDERLSNMSKRFERPILFPNSDLEFVSAEPYVVIRLSGQEYRTNLIGKYNYGNIASAIAVGRAFDVADPDILEAIGSYVPSNQRSQIIDKGNLRIVNDCYNANPTSMKAAIENLAQMPGEKMVILGDMKEVEKTEIRHREVGELIRDMGIDKAVFIGTAMKNAHLATPDSQWYENTEQFKEQCATFSFKGNVLIKGSRGMKLDTVWEIFE